MPSAQGHITVRRRAKDGTAGSDAVRYWVIPSATQIKRAQDGTMYPATVTCEKRKQTGNATPVVTSEGTLYYQIGYLDGSQTGKSVYGSGGVKATKTMTWIKFILEVSQVEVASDTVSVVADGNDSTQYWIVPSVSSISMKNNDGGDATPNPSSVSVIVISQSGVKEPQKITNLSAHNLKVRYIFSRPGTTQVETDYALNSAVSIPTNVEYTGMTFYLYKDSVLIDVVSIPFVQDGEKGDDAVRYWLSPSETSITRTSSGTFTPQKVKCQVMKQVGANAATSITTMFVRYRFVYSNALIMMWTQYSINTDIEISGTPKRIEFELYSSGNSNNSLVSGAVGSGNCLDRVTIPIVYDGKQGIQGCIYRRSKFSTGFEYHNDTELTTDGIRYIDLVYIMKDSTMFASHALWFRCRNTHNSDANNAPQKSNNGTEEWLNYWEPINTIEPIYTPLLLADDAVITLMQSNQILIANDEGVITAGMSGSLGGSKIRIWAGAQTPDSAPFRVDVLGKLFSSDAEITGKITATSGKIAGFNISGNSLTNGPEFANDACIVFRNDEHKTFAGIGGNVLPASSALRAVARFENDDINNFWGIGRNIAMLLSAKNGDINNAFLGSGNGNLDGWIGGYKYSKYSISSANTIYNGFLKISENNKWVVYAIGASSGVTLPTLTEVRKALGIGTSTPFCVEFTVVADLHSQNNFNVYGRCKKEVNVNGSTQTPYFTGEYPTMTHWNNGRYDSLEMGAGDSVVFLLIYDPNKTGVLDTSYTLMYTARIINRQN